MATGVELLKRKLLVMCSLRTSGPLILTSLLTATLSLQSHAQSPMPHSGPFNLPIPTSSASTQPSTDPVAEADKLPDAPGFSIASADPRPTGSILGTVTFKPNTPAECTGTYAWFRPASSGTNYPAGFATSGAVAGRAQEEVRE